MHLATKIFKVIFFLLIVFIPFEIQEVNAQIDSSCSNEIVAIQNYNLLESKRISKESCKGVYEGSNALFIVKSTRLENYTSAINFIAKEYSKTYLNSIFTKINNQNALKDHNSIIWLSDKTIYRIDFPDKKDYQEFVVLYLYNFPSLLGQNQDESIIILKEYESKEIKQDTGTSQSQIRAKVVIVASSSSCSKCGEGWLNICDQQECWGLGDCYSKTYAVVTYCYDRPKSGSEDYCIYKSQKNRGKCAKGEYDCDFNSECSGSLQCKGPIGGNLDGCCASDEEWKNYKCVKACSGATGKVRCSTGNVVEKEYYNSDCTTTWKKDEDCDDRDYYGSWSSNYCSDGNVIKSRSYYNYYCSNGICANTDTSDKKTVETCSNGCSNNQCKQCTSNSYKGCYNDDLYWYNSCNNKGDKFQDCQAQDSVCTSDDGGGRYYSGYCDTNQNKCMHSSFESCNDCSNGNCANKCEISSVRWSTSSAKEEDAVELIVEGDSDCNDKRVSFDILEDDSWPLSDTPAKNSPGQTKFSNGRTTQSWSAEWLDDGLFEGNPEYYFNINVDGSTIRSNTPDLSVSKKQVQCSLNSAYWEKTRSQENSPVNLTVEGTNCDGKTASFEVKENDGFGLTYNVRNNPPSAPFTNGKVTVSWLTEWVEDGYLQGDPEYLFIATADGKKITSNNELEVYQQCLDSDGDGYGREYSSACTYSGLDCKDDDSNIKPGAYDSCNSKDDNCDGRVDENNDKQTDVNNCGACNNVCSFQNANAGCSVGNCYLTTCINNYGNCDSSHNNGCEIYFLNDKNNCGSCRNICSTSQNCVNGVCADVLPRESKLTNECNSNADCPSNQFCNQVSGPDFCEPIKYKDECSNYNDYFCESGQVKKCINNGNYWEKQRIESCSGKYQYCDETVVDGTGKCSIYQNHLDAWVDYADTGVNVNKQPGDKLILNVYSEQSTRVNVRYNSEAFEGNCPNGLMGVSEGINSCELKVKTNAQPREEIHVENKISTVRIINDPEFLILTDSIKLAERFRNEENAVKALLKQTYSNAESKGIVYDLSKYELIKEESLIHKIIALNPFKKLSDYNEKVTDPSMTDNSYSIAASRFIKEKCKNCKDVIIVGDDFVVPHYRNEIVVDNAWLPFISNTREHKIYTDQNYIPVKSLPALNELDLIFTQEGRVEDKQVMFIVPDNIDADQEMRNSVNKLKDVIEKKFKTDDIPEKKGSEIILGDYGVPGTTLVIIGNVNNNPALRYYPFAISDDYNMFIDRNLWDPNRGFLQDEEYALIMNVDSAEILNLNTGVIASEMYKEINGEGINWVVLGGGTALLIISPLTGPFAPVVAAGGIAILSADTIDNCLIENQAGQNWDECSTDVIIDVASAGIFKVVKHIAKPVMTKLGKEAGEAVISRVSRLMSSLDPKATEVVIKQGDSAINAKYISEGIRIATKDSDAILRNTIRELPNEMDDIAKTNFFKGIGEFFEGKNVVEWEDVVGKGTKSTDETISKLSENARKVYRGSVNTNEELAKTSEALSFRNFEIRGGVLRYTEKEMAPDLKKFDYVINIDGKNYPVSVKRLVTKNPDLQGSMNKLRDASKDMIDARNGLPQDTYANENVLHYLVKSKEERRILEEALNQLKEQGQVEDNIKLIISDVPSHLMEG